MARKTGCLLENIRLVDGGDGNEQRYQSQDSRKSAGSGTSCWRKRSVFPRAILRAEPANEGELDSTVYSSRQLHSLHRGARPGILEGSRGRRGGVSGLWIA